MGLLDVWRRFGRCESVVDALHSAANIPESSVRRRTNSSHPHQHSWEEVGDTTQEGAGDKWGNVTNRTWQVEVAGARGRERRAAGRRRHGGLSTRRRPRV